MGERWIVGSGPPSLCGRHMAIVVYRRRWRDWWRKSYWVRCWSCDLDLGPWPDEGFAKFVAADVGY